MLNIEVRTPVPVYLPRFVLHPFRTHHLHMHKGIDEPWLVQGKLHTRAGCWKDGAGGNKNQYIFTMGARRRCVKLQGGAELQRTSLAPGWF